MPMAASVFVAGRSTMVRDAPYAPPAKHRPITITKTVRIDFLHITILLDKDLS